MTLAFKVKKILYHIYHKEQVFKNNINKKGKRKKQKNWNNNINNSRKI